ncbi:serine threonine- kinase dyrk2 isoform x1 [Pyrenophora seminiperda CCB06]|uniref:Serine threonine-kinase dyrk2 isoform x1 n=1 Tax=Pyrenophora seminiperda CCB06 TaxID=1302712 RepID=A0A3M7LXU8_9PLEO|nr:serine threonine- kinase dyrk2 isoform x1 [Pyrenophora seminiperda CCB06]
MQYSPGCPSLINVTVGRGCSNFIPPLLVDPSSNFTTLTPCTRNAVTAPVSSPQLPSHARAQSHFIIHTSFFANISTYTYYFIQTSLLSKMMKRNFSFNLAPVKVGSKPDLNGKSTPEPTPAQSPASHRRHSSKDSICDNSPFINRRVLDAQTDQQLRSACKLILQNFKPSDHGMENTDPKLDFGGLGRRKESSRPQQETRPHPVQVNVRMPTGAPIDTATTSFLPRKPSTKTRTRAKADLEIKARVGDVPARANSSRKRADFAWLDERDTQRDEKLKANGKTSIDVPRSATFRNDSDESITLPVAVTSNFASATVSSSLPTGKNTNRASHNSDPAAAADAQAAEWMRRELEKKKQNPDASDRQGRPSMSARPPSRTASIKSSVKEYVFPGSRSRALSRAQSKESLRSASTNNGQAISRNGSGSGWRGWVPRRSSSRSNSRPGTSKGSTDESAQPRKSESNGLDLNRELPPLPSLDSWKEPEKPQAERAVAEKSPKSPTTGTHIASVMRSHEELSSPQRKQRPHVPDALVFESDLVFPARNSSRKQGTQDIPQISRTVPNSPGNADQIMTNWSSTTHLDHRLELGSRVHTRAKSGGSHSASNSNKSTGDVVSQRSSDLRSHRTMSSDHKSSGKDEQKSKLKKIFSGWIHKKEKKEDWMHKMEKEGIKEGMLVQDTGPSASPVVRY